MWLKRIATSNFKRFLASRERKFDIEVVFNNETVLLTYKISIQLPQQSFKSSCSCYHFYFSDGFFDMPALKITW